LLEFLFFRIEFTFSGEISGAVVIWAFIGGDDFCFFPQIKCAVTVRAPVLAFNWTMMAVHLEKIGTDFASKLRAFFAVVVVDVLSGGIAVGATDGIENTG
jgi:hypothetical protein